MYIYIYVYCVSNNWHKKNIYIIYMHICVYREREAKL